MEPAGSPTSPRNAPSGPGAVHTCALELDLPNPTVDRRHQLWRRAEFRPRQCGESEFRDTTFGGCIVRVARAITRRTLLRRHPGDVVREVGEGHTLTFVLFLLPLPDCISARSELLYRRLVPEFARCASRRAPEFCCIPVHQRGGSLAFQYGTAPGCSMPLLWGSLPATRLHRHEVVQTKRPQLRSSGAGTLVERLSPIARTVRLTRYPASEDR